MKWKLKNWMAKVQKIEWESGREWYLLNVNDFVRDDNEVKNLFFHAGLCFALYMALCHKSPTSPELFF